MWEMGLYSSNWGSVREPIDEGTGLYLSCGYGHTNTHMVKLHTTMHTFVQHKCMENGKMLPLGEVE